MLVREKSFERAKLVHQAKIKLTIDGQAAAITTKVALDFTSVHQVYGLKPLAIGPTRTHFLMGLGSFYGCLAAHIGRHH